MWTSEYRASNLAANEPENEPAANEPENEPAADETQSQIFWFNQTEKGISWELHDGIKNAEIDRLAKYIFTQITSYSVELLEVLGIKNISFCVQLIKTYLQTCDIVVGLTAKYCGFKKVPTENFKYFKIEHNSTTLEVPDVFCPEAKRIDLKTDAIFLHNGVYACKIHEQHIKDSYVFVVYIYTLKNGQNRFTFVIDAYQEERYLNYRIVDLEKLEDLMKRLGTDCVFLSNMLSLGGIGGGGAAAAAA